MAEENLSKYEIVVDGEVVDAVEPAEWLRGFDPDGEKSRPSTLEVRIRSQCHANGYLKTSVAQKDALDDDEGSSIQTIRISNAASSHWLAMDDDGGRTSPLSPSYSDPSTRTSYDDPSGAAACKLGKVITGLDSESLQGPHCWRKRLKSASYLENGETKREPRRESEQIPDRSLKDRRLMRDDHPDEAKARSDKIRISPSAKKDPVVLRMKGQLVSKSPAPTANQSPNLLVSRAIKRGSKSQFDSESAFTRQVVRPMKSSSVTQRSRAIYPSTCVAVKNLAASFGFSGKRPTPNHHLDAFGSCSGGQVTKKMVDKVMKARLYLLQQTGPNSFLIGGDSPDHKYRVIIGTQKCSCGREFPCIHLLFVMLRVFQVPENDPLLSRRPLKNYEVEALFRNYHARRTSKLKDNTKKKNGSMTELKAFDRPNCSMEGDEDDDEDDDEDSESTATAGPDDDGNEKEEEDVCSICLLEMVEGESLTECKTGCQNRLHHHCIAIWFEECRRQKEALICPLCRAEWRSEDGETAVNVPVADELPLPTVARESSPQNADAGTDMDATPLEPLPPEHREMAEKWIPVLGEEIVSRLFSKNWSVREAALRLLSQEAVGVLLLGVGEGRSGVLVSAERQANNHTILDCCCSILAFMLSDPVYKVFVSSLRALRMILSYTPCRDELQQSRIQVLLRPVVKSLLLKCADSNRKTSQLSISALEELVKGQKGELALGREIVNPGSLGLGGIDYLVDCVVEIDAVENLHWQWVLGRFCMMERLLEEYSSDFSPPVTPPADGQETSVRLVGSSAMDSRNSRLAFSILRFCTFHMSFAHIKVSKMARRLFYCIARLQLQHENAFEKACLLLNNVEPAIQIHMKRKLEALAEESRPAPNGRPDPRASNESLAVLTSPTPYGGSLAMPRVSVTASSPVTDEVTLVLANAATLYSRISSGDSSVDQADGRCEVGSNLESSPQKERLDVQVSQAAKDVEEAGSDVSQARVEFADACVSTSPLPLPYPELWVGSPRKSEALSGEEMSTTDGLSNAMEVPSSDLVNGVKQTEQAGPVLDQHPGRPLVSSRPDNVSTSSDSDSAYMSLTRRSTPSSRERLFDSPPIFGCTFSSGQVGFLTEDLSDLILSPSGPEEKVSFKTEVATTPQNSPQRSANNTADNDCHCKEEVEKEEAEALVEALERSDLPQDALPHVPGLTRDKSETTLTIHLQDQTMSGSQEEIKDGFDSRNQYQEGFQWKRGPMIGTGAFSTCYQARDNKTGTLMAVKQISFCRNTVAEQDKVVNAVKEEIHILDRLNHPNIIRILGATQQGCHFFMFVEWMPGCSVASLLDKYGQFSEQVITSYTLQVVRGLAYLHENQVLHRDLKGANLLVDSTGHRVRIGDFGAAARLATRVTGAGEFEGQLLGTIAFMAPEVLRGDKYGRKCDIWSLGCAMVEMATALPPWGANDISNHLALIFKIASTVRPPPIPETLSPPVRDVMLRCLEVNPEDRPQAKDLLKHPAFRY